MKKLIISFCIIIGTLNILFTPEVYAEEEFYYKEDDYCGFYTGGAYQEEVIKCRYIGIEYCIYFEQIPCEEVCPWYMFPA
ncbi:hypothetical protein [Algoriphagus antarcticus]|uniref:Uncharacterized protein n=1 Tax=Algoriphagus antarcticus TaxID=238540 RepID=A0A3E0DJ77_9BACT|nr:hypothetical protein [Algoriphagus antarcticus]REG82812.1 hypothetical protein C8N25_120102 [Algoriphagus antarcticus]